MRAKDQNIKETISAKAAGIAGNPGETRSAEEIREQAGDETYAEIAAAEAKISLDTHGVSKEDIRKAVNKLREEQWKKDDPNLYGYGRTPFGEVDFVVGKVADKVAAAFARGEDVMAIGQELIRQAEQEEIERLAADRQRVEEIIARNAAQKRANLVEAKANLAKAEST